MSGTNSEKERIEEGPVIVLVEPQLGENIGMVARAMANFGLAELRLVNPRDGWPNEKARSAASKADHVIDGVQVFETLEAAIADLNFVYATTARERYGFKPVRSPVTACTTLRQKFNGGERTGILFGRERWGLSNEEVALADEIVTFPVNPAFASLNIAQAVLLMSYEWMKSGMDDLSKTLFQPVEQRPATKDELFGLFDHVEEALEARGYFHPAAKKPKMVDNLRAVLSRRAFTSQEIGVIRGVVASLDRFARRYPHGQRPAEESEGQGDLQGHDQ
ncbi:RNA methyltransferase [Gellertiella hungarica]|uniref:tRNA (cytidine/uridine-2'-O-)-methyltransferase TrmJ n=1 Tax=Gellertiella hungarica TaxID=1572859 RepID=A0A7W6NJP1_9HYPH|nr:RNA methyltransferase [Gellertiella hungarica]MBB4064625.1 tRNA/rRNA methyltransferase [Gellertiella hungarica]